MVQAQLRAPLAEGHAEIATEQPGQGAFAGADLTTELSQRPIVCRIGLEDLRDGKQQRLGRSRQILRLLR